MCADKGTEQATLKMDRLSSLSTEMLISNVEKARTPPTNIIPSNETELN